MLAKSYIDKGELVPDEVTIEMLKKEVEKYAGSSGLYLMVFPRTKDQASALDVFLQSLNTSIKRMIALNVPEAELISRILARGRKSGSSDDQDEGIIANRIKSL